MMLFDDDRWRIRNPMFNVMVDACKIILQSKTSLRTRSADPNDKLPIKIPSPSLLGELFRRGNNENNIIVLFIAPREIKKPFGLLSRLPTVAGNGNFEKLSPPPPLPLSMHTESVRILCQRRNCCLCLTRMMGYNDQCAYLGINKYGITT